MNMKRDMMMGMIEDIEMVKDKRCPNCNETNISTIIHGYPSIESKTDDKEKYVFGGCVVSNDDEDFLCNSCGEEFS